MNRYPKQPRVGDVIEVWVGLVTVAAVRDYGVTLDVIDATGRTHTVTRAERGCWFRYATRDGAAEALAAAREAAMLHGAVR